jgi:hypothetical protein
VRQFTKTVDSAVVAVAAVANTTEREPELERVRGPGVDCDATRAGAREDLLDHDTLDYLIGPAGMQCTGVVAVDGGTLIVVWPKGDPKPTQHAHEAGLTLALDPACVGCKEADACPFFSQFAVQERLPCPNGGIPPGEDAYGLTKNATLFEDPPGVAGDGWRSCGTDPANGVVGINVAEQSLLYRATCTVPSAQHSICTVALNDVIARYG